MNPLLVLKLKLVVVYLAALACAAIGGVCAHYVILPADWPLWRRILWGVIACYAIAGGKYLIDQAASSRHELRQYLFHQQQQRMAAAQRWRKQGDES